MTPGEIIHRARIALRDRFVPQAYEKWTPAEAFQRLFPAGVSRVPLDVTRVISPDIRSEAESLRRGEWRFFGRSVQLSSPPKWNLNTWTDREWPDRPSKEIDYRDINIAGGAKFTWEVGRLTFLPSLALADESDLAMQWLSDFTRENPLGHGILHTSGIEQGVRVITAGIAARLLGNPPDLYPSIGLLAQQALRLRDHLSLGSSANNHLLAEYAGMAMMGALYPELSDSADLMMEGAQGLEREVLRQITPDGCSVEQSFGYIPFIWELFLYPLVFAERAGYAVSQQTKDRLRDSLEFVRFLRLSNGTLPQVGDEDDGRILFPNEHGSRFDLVGNALATWLHAGALSADAQLISQFLFGKSSEPKAPEQGHRVFEGGGYEAWRYRETLVTIDVGPLGWGSIAAHGHADAMSITVFSGSSAIVIDPGCYAYQEDPIGRDKFRSTPYHSTVNFDGKSSSEMLGPFLWGKRATVNGHTCKWASGEVHTRTVSVGDEIVIRDEVKGDKPELVFILHPDAVVELMDTKAIVKIGGATAIFESQGPAPWRIEPGEYSQRIGHRQTTSRLCADFVGNTAVTTIRVSR